MVRQLFAKAPEPEVEREFMRSMVARASHSITANLAGVAILLLGCFFVPFGRSLALALAFRIVAICITAANTRALMRRIEAHRPLTDTLNRFALGMAFAGVTWAGLLWAIPFELFDSLSATLVRMVVISGVILVTLTAAPVPKAMIAFCGSFTLVAGAELALLSNSYGYMPLVVGLLVITAIFTFGVGMTREAQEAARTLVENQQLARELSSLNDDLNNALEKADRLARFDQLTGIANRLSFEECCSRAEAERTGKETLHVMLLDLDHFKAINDAAGHAGGDAVLRATANVLAESIQGLPEGAMAARIGGEEFALILRHLDDRGATAFGTLICDRVRHIVAPDGYRGRITTSIGLSRWTAGEPLHAAMKRADGALYFAKESGRNRVKMDERAAA